MLFSTVRAAILRDAAPRLLRMTAFPNAHLISRFKFQTARHTSAFPARMCARGSPWKFVPQQQEGAGDPHKRAQGMPGVRCTRGFVQKMHEVVHHKVHRVQPAFPAQWFYGFLRALPGDRAFLPPSPPRSLLLKDLTPASGRQDHTTSPSTSRALRQKRIGVHRIPCPTFVTMANAPLMGTGQKRLRR